MINSCKTQDDCASPCIVVYALADARAALQAAAECGIAVTLVSPPGAAATGGPAWFREMTAQAGAAVPDAKFDSVLDCAGEAGYALAAIRAGVAAISFEGPADIRSKIQDIADQSGCGLVTIDYEHALDLDQCTDTGAICRKWLAGRPKRPNTTPDIAKR